MKITRGKGDTIRHTQQNESKRTLAESLAGLLSDTYVLYNAVERLHVRERAIWILKSQGGEGSKQLLTGDVAVESARATA